MRRLGVVVLIAVVAIGLGFVLVTVVSSRDSAQVGDARGPGTLEPDRGAKHSSGPRTPASPPDRPPTSGPHRPEAVTRDGVALSDDQLLQALELGNVVFAYNGDKAPLSAIQRDVAGAFTPELAAAGQAVILDRRPGVKGVIALAWRRRLAATSASDPQLRAFAEAWLGQGPG